MPSSEGTVEHETETCKERYIAISWINHRLHWYVCLVTIWGGACHKMTKGRINNWFINESLDPFIEKIPETLFNRLRNTLPNHKNISKSNNTDIKEFKWGIWVNNDQSFNYKWVEKVEQKVDLRGVEEELKVENCGKWQRATTRLAGEGYGETAKKETAFSIHTPSTHWLHWNKWV